LRRNLPPYRTTFRVMRLAGDTLTEVCRHRWERRAYRHARREDRRTGPGVMHIVQPAVTA
jgi:hypothetical protein